MENINIDTKERICLSAIDPYKETNMVDATETDIKGKEFVGFGKNNDYPDYLASLYKDVPTLQTVINGAVDYSCGDDIILSKEPYGVRINEKNETVNTVVRNAFMDYWTYGAFALNIVRNKMGGIAGVYYLNVKDVRSDKKNTMFYYSEDWSKSFGRVKFLSYPAFDASKKDASSILYVKRNYNGTYGFPVYGSAVKSCEIEKSIDTYHLNAINNNFAASYIVNFNDGVPSEEVQEDIEEGINEKFSGYQNAARIMIAFNKTKDNAVTVEKLDSDDWGEKYQSLAKRSQTQIYTAFRANPNLFGVATESNGFNSEEYSSTYKLFNKTMILPAQRLMCDTFKKIFGDDCLEIKPFVIDFSEDGDNNAKTIE